MFTTLTYTFLCVLYGRLKYFFFSSCSDTISTEYFTIFTVMLWLPVQSIAAQVFKANYILVHDCLIPLESRSLER